MINMKDLELLLKITLITKSKQINYNRLHLSYKHCDRKQVVSKRQKITKKKSSPSNV